MFMQHTIQIHGHAYMIISFYAYTNLLVVSGADRTVLVAMAIKITIISAVRAWRVTTHSVSIMPRLTGLLLFTGITLAQLRVSTLQIGRHNHTSMIRCT